MFNYFNTQLIPLGNIDRDYSITFNTFYILYLQCEWYRVSTNKSIFFVSKSISIKFEHVDNNPAYTVHSHMVVSQLLF